MDPLSAQANYISCTFKVEEVLWENAPYMLCFVLRRTNSSQKDPALLLPKTWTWSLAPKLGGLQPPITLVPGGPMLLASMDISIHVHTLTHRPTYTHS